LADLATKGETVRMSVPLRISKTGAMLDSKTLQTVLSEESAPEFLLELAASLCGWEASEDGGLRRLSNAHERLSSAAEMAKGSPDSRLGDWVLRFVAGNKMSIQRTEEMLSPK
jgi:hypothetical protein